MIRSLHSSTTSLHTLGVFGGYEPVRWKGFTPSVAFHRNLHQIGSGLAQTARVHTSFRLPLVYGVDTQQREGPW